MANRTGTDNAETLFGTDDNDVLRGLGGDDELYGLDGIDILDGGDGNDWLDAGLGDNEALYGGNGNDTLFGSGITFMEGGADDDLYYVNNVNDTIVEESGQGLDTVRSTVSYSIAGSGFVENLVLEGYSAINAMGNGLNNEIFGNVSDNSISGGDGNDVLRGGDGNDILRGDGGDDHLVGGSGSNQLIGGTGNDIYYVENATTTVSESASEGYDGVRSTVSFTLTADVEILALDGTADINGTGNSLDNSIYGNTANNSLSGGGGNDYLVGLLGNDIIVGGTGQDTAGYSGHYTTYNASFTSTGAVQITGSEGTDRLTGIERINFEGGGYYNIRVGDGADNRLTADLNVWSLVFGGGGNDTITGSNGNDTLSGSSGNDGLIGGNGSDILSGGTGADKFRFNLKSEGIDLIKDFNRSEGDKIQIVKSSFGATSLSQFSYNNTTGVLSFGSTQLATLENRPTGFSVQTDVVLV